MTENQNKERKPGDLILDRYFPDAPPEVRELARERFKELGLVLLGIARRRVEERMITEAEVLVEVTDVLSRNSDVLV